MKTLFDKIWDAHVVSSVENGPTQLYMIAIFVMRLQVLRHLMDLGRGG